ncbi:MAG: hypothetical protein JNL34_11485, partial [Anaerolineae bacterium]|nr:hypothetical protein [Anaerolineae bacterium]
MKRTISANLIALAIMLTIGVRLATAQEGPTATPQPVNLATTAPEVVPGTGATPTRTPTPEGQFFLEAREFANV